MVYALGKKILLGNYEPVTGDPQRDTLICALRAIEQREGERRGWDQQPQLWTLHLPDLTSDAVEVRPIPVRAWQRGCTNPADDVAMTAAAIGRPPRDIPVVSFTDTPDQVAGVAMMVESWGVFEELMTDKDRAARAAGQRNLHTNPHRLELRNMVMADINGYGCTLNRVRGRDPEPPLLFTREEMQSPPGQGPGPVVRALFSLAWATVTGLFRRRHNTDT